MSHYSFFHLTAPRPAPSDNSPLDALTPDEFDAGVVARPGVRKGDYADARTEESR